MYCSQFWHSHNHPHASKWSLIQKQKLFPNHVPHFLEIPTYVYYKFMVSGIITPNAFAILYAAPNNISFFKTFNVISPHPHTSTEVLFKSALHHVSLPATVAWSTVKFNVYTKYWLHTMLLNLTTDWATLPQSYKNQLLRTGWYAIYHIRNWCTTYSQIP